MQTVKISKDNFDSFEKDTLLTLEQAEWYTQDEGFIPLPRKANKENIKVLFSTDDFSKFVLLLNKKIKQYRASVVVDDEGKLLGAIYVLELMYSETKEIYYDLFTYFWKHFSFCNCAILKSSKLDYDFENKKSDIPIKLIRE